MSVYSSVSKEQLTDFLKFYRLGELISFNGIEDGIDNTNYRLHTSDGDYILTLFENLTDRQLPFYLDYLSHLHRSGLTCPQPQKDCNGDAIRFLQSKPCVIFNLLKGESQLEPTAAQCAAIGRELGKIHRAGLDYPEQKANEMGEDWQRQTFARLKTHLPDDEKQLIEKHLALQNEKNIDGLPKGIIHADLFKDNALFESGRLSGILDFYVACHDDLLLDLAITANDWCQHQGHLQADKIAVLLDAYQRERALTVDEKRHWPFMLQKAALRFWLSRLDYRHFPRTAELTVSKDPDVYKQIFVQHEHTQPL